ncbi:MAG: GWxTD domain-containing protein [Candidatus Aminicenantales bacterium]
MKSKLSLFVLALIFLAVACGMNSLPSRDSWYAQHYFIMHDYEQNTYRQLTSAGRLEFQKLFWEARQPVAKQEFDNRLLAIQRLFKTENRNQPWNTDRARVYLLNGSPASIDYRQNTDWVTTMSPSSSGVSRGVDVNDRTNEDIQANTAEIWVYPYDKYFIYYIFTFSSPSSWKLDPATFQNNRYLQNLEELNKDLTFAVIDEEAYKAKLAVLPHSK